MDFLSYFVIIFIIYSKRLRLGKDCFAEDKAKNKLNPNRACAIL